MDAQQAARDVWWQSFGTREIERDMAIENVEFIEEIDSDVEALGADAVSQAVVYASDWTTE